MDKGKKCFVSGMLVGLITIFVWFQIAAVPVKAQEKVKLEIWTFGSFFTDYYKKIISKYQQMRPNVEIEVREISYSAMFDDLIASFISGVGAPDIADIEQQPFSRFLKGEIGLVDLTSRVEPYLKDYIKTRVDMYSYKGKIYGIDHAVCPVQLYYRWDIFKDAGIQTPIETWKDFITAGKKVTYGKRFMTALPDSYWGQYVIWLIQRESGIFDENGEVIIDTPLAIDTLQFYVDLINKYKIAMIQPETPAEYAAMREGHIACMYGADWYGMFIQLNVPELAGKWQAQALPVWEKGGSPTSCHGGTAYTITKQCKHPEEAWKFIEFALFNEENKMIEYEVNGLLPPIRSMLGNPRLLQPIPYYNNQRLGLLYKELAPQIPVHYRAPFWEEAITMLNTGINDIIHRGKAPKAVLSSIANELRKLTKD